MAAAAVAPEPLFVGRVTERAELRRLLEAAAGGRGGLVAVAGDAGIGKTSLLERLAADAAATGMAVAWASCWHGPQRPSFWPWIQVMRAVGPPGAAELLETRGAASRPRLFDDVVGILRDAARDRPHLVVIDDLHWADAASVRLLAHAARSLRDAPVLLAGSYRDAEIDDAHPLADLLAEHLLRAAVALRGFGEHEVVALVDALVGAPPGTASTIHRRTGGNPLFVRELLRLLASEGRLDEESLDVAVPAGVRAVLQRRLDHLPAAVGRLLGVAAVIGEEFDLALLAAAAGMAIDDVSALLDDAVAARMILHDRAGQARFAHPLVRDVRYSGLSGADRSALHLAVATALEDRHTAHADAHLATTAFHLLRSGPAVAERATAAAVRAAERALAVLDHEGAVELLRAALDSARSAGADPGRTAELLLLLGDALVRTGDLPSARDVHGQVADVARRIQDPALLARAALGYGAGLTGFEIQLWDRSQVDLLEEALAALPADASALRASVLARLSVALSLTDRPQRREPLAREAVAMARGTGDGATLAYALSAYADAIAGPAHVEERLEVATEMVLLAQRSANAPLELLGRRFRVVALLELGRLADVDDEIMAYSSLAERLRQPLYSWYVPLWLGMRALLDGRLEECERLAGEAAAIGRQAHSQNAELLTQTQLLNLREAQGRLGDFLAQFGLGVELPEAARLSPGVRAIMALVAAHLGELARAQAELDRFTASGFAEIHDDAEYLSNLYALAHVAVMLGDPRAAAALEPLLAPYAGLLVVDGIAAACGGSVAHLLGQLAAVQERWDDAVEHLEHALDVHIGHGALPLVVRTRFALADVLAARAGPGDADRAAELHHVASHAARQLGISVSEGPGSPPIESRADQRFLRDGELWLLAYAGTTARVRDAKGVRDLARLVATPGVPVHVSELVAGAPARGRSVPAAEDDLTSRRGAPLDPVLDRGARDSYRRRIAELEDDITDAERCNDPVRATRAREELDVLTAELTRAFGIGGRPRTLGDPVERARKAVTARIRESIARIGDVHPALGRHLDRSVRTGTFCVYEPEQPLRWQI